MAPPGYSCMVEDVVRQRRHSEREKHEVFRRKAYEWLIVTDHMLWVACDMRWSDLVLPPEDERPPPSQWRICTLSVDQGSDGWTSAYFLAMQAEAGLMICKDPSHRLWNDTWLALEHANMKAIFILMIVVLNSDHGPWADARWAQSAREAAVAYMAVGNSSDPLFARHAMQIVKEMGLEHRLDEGDALLDEVMLSIPDSVRCLSMKVASSRWFGVFDALERFLPLWSRRLLLMQFMGVGLGLFKVEAASVLARFKVQAPPTEGQDVQQQPTGKEGVDIAAMRKACKNTLQLCCLTLGDPDIRRLVEGTAVLARSIRREFQWQHCKIRSAAECCEAYSEWSTGRGRQALQEMVSCFHGGELTAVLGLATVSTLPLASLGKDLDVDDPVILSEGMVVERLANFVLQLIKNRLRSLSWNERATPAYSQGCCGRLPRPSASWRTCGLIGRAGSTSRA